MFMKLTTPKGEAIFVGVNHVQFYGRGNGEQFSVIKVANRNGMLEVVETPAEIGQEAARALGLMARSVAHEVIK